MYGNLVVIAVFTVFYSLVAGGMARTVIFGPILFVTFGLVAGPVGLGILDIDLDQHTLRTLIDMTLCLILFVDAASADLHVLKRRLAIPQRMLLIGLPLVIVFVIIVVGEDLPGGGVLAVTVVCTVCMSIVLHGISANPLANRFAAQVNK